MGITLHHSSVASRNDRRVFDAFSENLKRWCRDGMLLNEIQKGQE